MTIIFNAEIQTQYFCYFSFGVSILFCLSFLDGMSLSQTDAVCGISSEIQSSFRISLIFIQICYSKQSYCYKHLSIYLCSRQYKGQTDGKQDRERETEIEEETEGQTYKEAQTNRQRETDRQKTKKETEREGQTDRGTVYLTDLTCTIL